MVPSVVKEVPMASRDLTPEEVRALQREWRAVFARRLHRLTGRWSRGGDRYVFDRRYMLKYLCGAKAEDEYGMQEATSFYLLEDDGRSGQMFEDVTEKPSLSKYAEQREVIIFPPTYDWTVAVGPDYFDRICFTYREWVDDDDAVE